MSQYICLVKNTSEEIFVKVLHFISKDYFGALSHMMAGRGPDRNYYTLLLICNSENGCTQKELGEILEVDKVTMSRKIDHLCKLDYVRREPNPEDRRTLRIVPTAKALKILPELQKAFDLAEQEAFRGIPKAERRAFLATAAKVRSNIAGMPRSTVKVEYKQKNKKR